MLLLYNLLSFIALLIYLPLLLLKKGPEKRLEFVGQRLGVSNYAKIDIWVHAVSVGETIACLPFLRMLKKEFPDSSILFSTTTYTGQKVAREKFTEADRVMYMPWDTGPCIKRAVNVLRPKIFITVETELWPVLFDRLKRAGSLIVLLNGRLSPKSFSGYKLLRSFMKRVISNVDFLYMQGRGDAERILALGADKDRVGIMGNLKFDIEFERRKPLRWIKGLKGNILLAGSTHKGEDEIILDAFEIIKKDIIDIRLILAPRHPERFNEVGEMIKKRGFRFLRRSEIDDRSETWGNELYDVILLDTIGELFQTFSKATIVFIGGSLMPYGGHNILEPAYWSKPVIFGPYMENFPVAGEFLQRSAARVVRESNSAAQTVIELAGDADRANDMGRRARTIVDANTGAAKKAVVLIRSLLGTA
jgi:3-deoxy-D-manno-octulosonic-acid transferase